MSNKGVCRTAPATPGLLTIIPRLWPLADSLPVHHWSPLSPNPTVRALLLTTNDSSVYVPTASSTLLFLSSVVGSLQGSLVRQSPNLPYSEGIGSPEAAIPLLKVV